MSSGYIRVRAVGHPTAHADGYALEHRLVAWGAGILTDLTDDVHHKNGVKDDNRPENLEAMRKGEHHRLHASVGPFTNQFGIFDRRPDRCSVDGCSATVASRGLCSKHITRLARHGSTEDTVVSRVDRALLPLTRDDIVAMFDAGQRPRWIAEDYKISQHTIKRVLHDAGRVLPLGPARRPR